MSGYVWALIFAVASVAVIYWAIAFDEAGKTANRILDTALNRPGESDEVRAERLRRMQ